MLARPADRVCQPNHAERLRGRDRGLDDTGYCGHRPAGSTRMTAANLYQRIPAELPEESFETLFTSSRIRIERIVSCGHATADGTWYDQERPEWVALLQGQAGLRMEHEPAQTLNPGDYVLIPAHRRHRVEWTSTTPPAVWLAIHFDDD